jgi:hypothetical protein
MPARETFRRLKWRQNRKRKQKSVCLWGAALDAPGRKVSRACCAFEPFDRVSCSDDPATEETAGNEALADAILTNRKPFGNHVLI